MVQHGSNVAFSSQGSYVANFEPKGRLDLEQKRGTARIQDVDPPREGPAESLRSVFSRAGLVQVVRPPHNSASICIEQGKVPDTVNPHCVGFLVGSRRSEESC